MRRVDLDHLAEIERLALLAYGDRLEQWQRVQEHWLGACRQAVANGDLGVLAEHWPPAGGSRPPLDVLNRRSERDLAKLAQAVVGLASIAIQVGAGGHDQAELLATLLEAARLWRDADFASVPGRFIPGHWRQEPLAQPGPAAAALAELVDRLGGRDEQLHLVMVRELLWYLVDHQDSGWGGRVEVRILLDDAIEGLVRTLVVERRRGGTGACLRHPVHASFTRTDAPFEKAVGNAWAFVRARVTESRDVDVRWWVDNDETRGPSAGAAFAVAFSTAVDLSRPRINARVAIIGSVDAQGGIGATSLDSYERKLGAAHRKGLRVIVPDVEEDRARRIAHRALVLEPARNVDEACDKASLSQAWRVPLPPRGFVARTTYLDALKEAVLRASDGYRRIGVWGMAGVGKSSLVAHLARDPEIRSAFVDGVMWVELGAESRVVERQRELAEFLGGRANFTVSEEGQRHLQDLLIDRACLVVIDNVVDATQLADFPAPGPRGALVYTTQDRGLVFADGAEFELRELDEEGALAMLEQRLGDLAKRPEAKEVARRCGHLPVALAMVAGMVREGRDPWGPILHSLRQDDLGRLELPSVIEAAVAQLDEGTRNRYEALAVFWRAGPVPESAVGVMWNLGDLETRRDLQALADRSLVRWVAGEGVSLHEVQRGYLRRKAHERLPILNGQLVDGYRHRCQAGWATGPDDGYFFQRLVDHLSGAGRHGELEALLMDFEWLSTKVAKTGLATLLADYDAAPDLPELRLLQGALRLSAHAMSRDRDFTQFAAQMLGRLDRRRIPGLSKFLDVAEHYDGSPWLQPIAPSLTPPGGLLLTTLAGHGVRVNAVAVTPDRRTALSGSADGTVRGWDLESGQLRYALNDHSQAVTSMVVTPDGLSALSGSADGTVRVWDPETGNPRFTLAGHLGPVISVVVTRDGRSALSVSVDRTVRVWDLDTGEVQGSFAGIGLVIASATDADQCWVVPSSAEDTLQLCDLAQGPVGYSLIAHDGRVTSLAVTPDGRFALSGSADRTVGVWDLHGGRLRHSLRGHDGPVTSVAITPDGRFALSGSADRTVRVWDIHTGQLRHALTGHDGPVTSVAVTPDGRFALSGSADRTVRVWALQGKPDDAAALRHAGPVTAVSLTPDGLRALSGSADSTLRLWDLTSRSVPSTLTGHQGQVSSVAVSADGRTAVSGSWDRTVRAWDLVTGQMRHTMRGHTESVETVAVTPDGLVALSASWDRTVRVWDLRSGRLRHVLRGHEGRVTAVGITSFARLAVSGSADHTVRAWDLESGGQHRTLMRHEGTVTALTVAPDGEWVLSASEDGTIRIVDVGSGQVCCCMRGEAPLTAVSVARGGERVVSGSENGTISMWDRSTGQMHRSLRGHQAAVTALALTLDGRLAVSGSADHTVRAWDLDRGQELATFTSDSAIRSCRVTFTSGVTIACGDGAGAVHILRLRVPPYGNR